MPIKLTDIKNIATIVKTKYGSNLFQMNFVFCFKKKYNSYFIFQEIQGMPIKRVVYHESNNSVSFVASWSSWSNPFALVADANYNKIESWKDLQDRSRPYNSYIKIDGGFNSIGWDSYHRQNRVEKKKKHKDKTDAFVEFRIDQIERAYFNEWGFELYSSTISIIAFNHRHLFPYTFEDDGNQYESNLSTPVSINSSLGNSYNQAVSSEDIISTMISWQGRSFNISQKVNNSNTPQSTLGYFTEADLESYWDASEDDAENEEFDIEMGNYFLEDREDDERILDVGQKKIDLYFD